MHLLETALTSPVSNFFQALAAGMFILGSEETAIKLLSLFKWGNTFLTLNNDLLEAYSKAGSEEELSEIESQFF